VARSPGATGGVISFTVRGRLEDFYDRLRLAKGPSFGMRTTLICPFMYLAHYDMVTTETGRAELRANGLDPSRLAFQDTRIPAAAVIQLLEDSAAESGRDDFGVRLAELRQFSNLGPLSLVLREEPDVRSALELLIRYEHTFNEAMRLRMTERNELVALSVAFELANQSDFTFEGLAAALEQRLGTPTTSSNQIGATFRTWLLKQPDGRSFTIAQAQGSDNGDAVTIVHLIQKR